MTVEQFQSKIRIEGLMKEVETIENSLYLVLNERVKESREHKAEFYYGVLNGIIKQLKKEYKIMEQKMPYKDQTKLKKLQLQLFENCSKSFQEQEKQEDNIVSID